MTQHEYVYGPEYVDEFVLQSYRDNGVQKSLYMLQDGNYNVMALLDENGAVVEQYQWEPYGSLATVDVAASPRPDNSVGHQGLFFYRFDSGDSLSLNALGLYHNRNRWYSPALGRFTSRDPNETALLVISVVATNGETMLLLASGCDAEMHFADGMNRYAYLTASPVNGADPLGLMEFSYVGTTNTQATNSYLSALDAQRVGIAKGFLIGLLGYAVLDGAWGVGGGVSSAGFDLILDGVAAMQMGAYAASETLFIAGASLTTLVVERTVDEAFNAERNLRAIKDKYIKANSFKQPKDPNDPDDEEFLKKTWRETKELAARGKNWAKTIVKEFCKKKNWKKDPRRG